MALSSRHVNGKPRQVSSPRITQTTNGTNGHAPRIADPAPPARAAGPLYPSPPEWRELHARARQIWDCVRINTSEKCKLHRAFSVLFQDESRPPTARDIVEALGSFNRLSAPERRRILNGWSSATEGDIGFSIDETLDRMKNEGGDRYVHLVIEPGAGRWKPFAFIGFQFQGCPRPSFSFPRGTTKSSALRALDEARKTVAAEWDRLVSDPYDHASSAANAAADLLASEPAVADATVTPAMAPAPVPTFDEFFAATVRTLDMFGMDNIELVGDVVMMPDKTRRALYRLPDVEAMKSRKSMHFLGPVIDDAIDDAGE